ncbi:efflux RND transporter periplasmic adaptor subunit [Massilia sp. NEAU-DD11]|uniref:Efflux RND transporter periplasmic adaptor subunit n=1 Tax=Massilia cellulosiltytica TaxID=2683234 RepID=A0A7X3G3Y2_9BURK|nr:efflux RND transporter periplasmic adaptor subunit [Telluria cellulosilytica]MVW63276.1 efflux RND transporter periplasmic adaptor subunit [Telluria cellulosilytica]
MQTPYPLMTKTRPALVAFGAAGLVAAALAGCSDATGKAAPASVAGGQPLVSAAIVVEKAIAETQEFSGRLEAVDVVAIRPRVSGVITAVKLKPGGETRKGDVLFEIDPRPFRAEAERAEATALAARARADLARLELARAERLLGDKAIAQREFDERAAARKELDASARAARAQADAATLNLSYTRVTAPIDGRVSKAEITVGNLVDPASVLTSVVSLDRVYASFDGDENTYLRVARQARSGPPIAVRVGLANEEGFPHEGRLEFVDNQLDTRTGSVRLRAVFANDNRALAPGLFARVQIGGGDRHPTLLVTDRAVGTDQNHKFVYVVDAQGKAERRDVTLGPVVDGLRVVHGGLKPGEKIVVNGLQRVKAGQQVRSDTVSMAADDGKTGDTQVALAAASPKE